MTETRNCNYCGEEYEKTRQWPSASCSPKCSLARKNNPTRTHRAKVETLICDWCEVEFTALASQKRVCCSAECAGKRSAAMRRAGATKSRDRRTYKSALPYTADRMNYGNAYADPWFYGR